MEQIGSFLEIDGEMATAPFWWVFRPAQGIRVKFGVREGNRPVEACLRWTHNEAQPETDWQMATGGAIVEPDTVAIEENVYRLFEATIPGIPGEGSLRYEAGYVDEDGQTHWMGETRFVQVAVHPVAASSIPSSFLGVRDGLAVYGPRPRRPVTPSPTSWQDLTIYHLLLDRFTPGDPAQQPPTLIDRNLRLPTEAHGGDFKGLRKRLPYLKSLGIGAIWIGPVQTNAPTGYHGYHALNLMGVDPKLGTPDDLRALVREAHEAGIYVLLDMVANHMADSLELAENTPESRQQVLFRFEKGDKRWPLPVPVDMRHKSYLHLDTNRDAESSDDVLTTRELFALDDWKTETGHIRTLMTAVLCYWIAEFDIDGFRLDAVRHVDVGFWNIVLGAVKRYTAQIGKENFLVFGEHADTNAAVLSAFLWQVAPMDGLLDFALYARIQKAYESSNLSELQPSYNREAFYYRNSRNNVAFLDNHDKSRFLGLLQNEYGRNEQQAIRDLHTGLALLILGPGIPCIYYGTEQAFDGYSQKNPDHMAREDMFPNPECRAHGRPVNRPRFAPYDTTNDTFGWICTLNDIRSNRWKGFRDGQRLGLVELDNHVLAYLVWSEGLGSAILVLIHIGHGDMTLSVECILDAGHYRHFPESLNIFLSRPTALTKVAVSPGGGADVLWQPPRLRFLLSARSAAVYTLEHEQG